VLGGLKGRFNIAQGNALGARLFKHPRALKGRPRSAVKKWRAAETEREVVRLEGSFRSI